MLKKGICKAEITFGILEIYRVYLMRHGRGTNFTCFDFLLEILHRYIAPHIAAQINQYGIDALHIIEKRCLVIVMFNLGSMVQAFKSEVVFNKIITKFSPVNFRVCYIMGIK